jgi:hypothetical protein
LCKHIGGHIKRDCPAHKEKTARLTSHGASLVVTFVAFLSISKKLTDLFYKEISELRILYFACSLFRVTIQDFYVIWIVENLVFCLITV